LNLLGLVVTIAAAVIAYIATRLVMQNAERLGLVAHSNERSSHEGDRPTGGGLGLATGSAVAAVPMAAISPWPGPMVLACTFLIAVLGYYDDSRSLGAGFRFIVQFLLFGLAAASILLGPGVSLAAILVWGVVVVAGVYWINIFNFMDGIDGLAASEAAFILAAAAMLAVMAFPELSNQPMTLWMLGLAAAALGFLLLNFPPAKIFMGDTGSLHLGFAIAILAVLTVALGWLTLPQWLILVAAFVADATVTLAHRAIRGENVTEAHRRHAYQFLARRFGHARVTLGFGAVNVVWLLPLAMLAGFMRQWEWLAVAAAYVPLVAGAIWAGAGRPEER
jgi:Fuc2NAc and GlcNAc transferase